MTMAPMTGCANTPSTSHNARSPHTTHSQVNKWKRKGKRLFSTAIWFHSVFSCVLVVHSYDDIRSRQMCLFHLNKYNLSSCKCLSTTLSCHKSHHVIIVRNYMCCGPVQAEEEKRKQNKSHQIKLLISEIVRFCCFLLKNLISENCISFTSFCLNGTNEIIIIYKKMTRQTTSRR